MDSGSPILMLGIILVIFLVCREIVCWYFKQSEQVALLKDIRNMMAKQYGIPIEKSVIICQKCGAKNRAQDSLCAKCGTPILRNDLSPEENAGLDKEMKEAYSRLSGKK